MGMVGFLFIGEFVLMFCFGFVFGLFCFVCLGEENSVGI